MKFRGILAIIFSLSLALFAGNALAGGKSDKAQKNDKQSSKHSEKSAQGPKSSKPGNGYGHCKSDKSGKGHAKKKGKGHERDDDCDDDGEPPVLICIADVDRINNTIVISGEGPDTIKTVSVNFVGKVCDVEGSSLSQYTDPISIPSENQTCFASSEIVGEYTTSETEYWYPIDILLECELTLRQ